MRLTKMACDGCGRAPGFWEWVRAEFSTDGYENWRHPGIAFREAGCPWTYDNQGRCSRLFQLLFGRPVPEDLSFLCPDCQRNAAMHLPGLYAQDLAARPDGYPEYDLNAAGPVNQISTNDLTVLDWNSAGQPFKSGQ